MNSTVKDVGLLIVRVGMGLMLALAHGLQKFPPSEGFVEVVSSLGFPLPLVFAWAAVVSELFGGLFLAIGLFTRPTSALIVITMSVAAFLANAHDPFASKEKALLYGLIALGFMFAGSGKFGLDTLLKQRSLVKRPREGNS